MNHELFTVIFLYSSATIISGNLAIFQRINA